MKRCQAVPFAMFHRWDVSPVEDYNNENVIWGPWFNGYANSWHGFCEDWRLESIWRNPERSLKFALEKKWVVGPDYSLLAGSCREVLLWQLFRRSQITGYWQANGANVIPCLGWAPELSIEDTLMYHKGGGIYAVRAPGKEFVEPWTEFATKLCEALEPKLVLHFGPKRGIEAWGGVGVQQVIRHQRAHKFFP